MIGIMGTRTVIKTGSFNSKFIPSLHVLVEDDLAKTVVDCLCEPEPYFSRKYIMSGAWSNQASCLYGFYTYGMEMEAHKIPSFGIVAIIDGDITEKAIKKRVSDVIKGDHKNSNQREIIEKIANSTTSFNLEHKHESINALPEYNHKKWFEEITEDQILEVNASMEHGFVSEKPYITSLLELIEFSKYIGDEHPLVKNDKGKPDYHQYYDIITSDFRASNTDHKMNNIKWYILSCIKHYNNGKWQFYTNAVLEKIRSINEVHRQKFRESDVDLVSTPVK